MTDLELTPGDRLRMAREAASVSRRQLAAKVGKALSTIRAHENGQNTIRPEAARDYASELGVSASHILYGSTPFDDVPENIGSTKGLAIKVEGRLSSGPFVPGLLELPLPFSEIVLSLPGYDSSRLSAYLITNLVQEAGVFDLVVVTPRETDVLRLTDEVVLINKFPHLEGPLTQRSLWKVGAEGGWATFYQGARQSEANSVFHTSNQQDLAMVEVVGVVVARLTIVRPPDAVRLPPLSR